MGETQKPAAGANGAHSPAKLAEEALRKGLHGEAGRAFLAAGRPYEAAVCFQKDQDLKSCFKALLQVQKASPNYRAACVHAVRLAPMIGESLASLSTFALHFLVTPPASPTEAAAMKEIADALAAADRPDFAQGIFQRVLHAYPNDAEAKESLEELLNRPPPEAPPPPSTQSGIRRALQEKIGSGRRLGELIMEHGRLTSHHMQLLLGEDKRLEDNDRAFGDVLVVNGFATETQILQALTQMSQIPWISEAKLLSSITLDMAKYLTREQSENWRAVPVTMVRRQLYFAMRDPRDWELLDQLRFAAGVGQVAGLWASEACIRKGQRKLYHGEEPEPQLDDELWDLRQETVEVTRFSDKVTKTREHEFDTGEFELRHLREQGLSTEQEQHAERISQEMIIERTSGVRAAPTPAQGPLPFTSSGSGVHAQPGVAGPSPRSSGSDTVGMAGAPPGQPQEGPPPVLKSGAVIAGRYHVLGVLGQGGSAMVYRALDSELNEQVAIKLFGRTTESQSLLARYKQELSLARKLTHPNIIRLYDLGMHEGCRYLSMELLEGRDLSTMLDELGPPPVAVGVDYLMQACLGLQAAHDQGVIHRDVKPQNLFITDKGQVKLVDFGLAKKEQAANITVAGMIAGTPDYMSPEQINNFSSVTYLTDLYALGATAYHIFTGAPPFEDDGLVALLMAHAQRPPTPLTEKVPGFPELLDKVILKLLEKDPAKRFQSARETAEALSQVRAVL